MATIDERLGELERRIQKLEHGVAAQLLALHAKVNPSHEILTGVQQAGSAGIVVLAIPSNAAAKASESWAATASIN